MGRLNLTVFRLYRLKLQPTWQEKPCGSRPAPRWPTTRTMSGSLSHLKVKLDIIHAQPGPSWPQVIKLSFKSYDLVLAWV